MNTQHVKEVSTDLQHLYFNDFYWFLQNYLIQMTVDWWPMEKIDSFHL